MEIYENKVRLTSDHTAMNGLLRPSAMFCLLQDAAAGSASSYGAGMEELSRRGILWMVVHMRADVLRLPAFGDEITVSTWIGEEMHGLFMRFYEMRFASGETAVKASGAWVLVDAATRTLARNAEVGMPSVVTGRETEPPRRLRMPELDRIAPFTAQYSHCDINGHMNNARYLDAAEDLIPVEYLMAHRLRFAAADYLKEVLPGETLQLGYGCAEGAWWFRGDGAEPCFRIKLIYE